MKPMPRSIALLKRAPHIHQVARRLLLFFFFFFALMAFAPWQQTASGSGKVLAYSPSERQQTISAPVDGRLGKWHVQEGSKVKKGDVIVDIMDLDPSILENLDAEYAAVTQRLKVSEHAAATAALNVKRQENLYRHGVSSRRAYEQAKLEYARFASDQANNQAELSRIKVRLSRQQSQKVQAPMAGTILRRFSGQESVVVKAGQSIAELVPDTRSRAVELWIDGNDVPLVSEGDNVRLQFEGWPAIQFSGWPSVAVGTFGGVVAVVDAADNGQGLFRVLVVPGQNEWPAPKYLRQGVRAHGWILLRKVTVAYELWRRFNGFPPSQSEPNATE